MSKARLEAQIRSDKRLMKLLWSSFSVFAVLFFLGVSYGVVGTLLGLTVNVNVMAGLTFPFGFLTLGVGGGLLYAHSSIGGYSSRDAIPTRIAEREEKLRELNEAESARILKEYGLDHDKYLGLS